MTISPQLPGYRFVETLYEGSKTVVWRGVRLADERPVAIKLLQQEYPTFNELVQFRNQYAIARNLDITGIIRPYSLESYRNSYALIMEDFGGVCLRDYARENPLSVTRVLDIAVQVVEILQVLHANFVIHKDIKPANLLIHPLTHQIKLIDFSIASLLPKETQEIKNPNVLEGTLAYLAPEQTGRMNRGVDYRSDFYSFGITLFELLAGQLPFPSSDAMELVHCHIAQQPPSLVQFGVPEAIAAIVGKLMAKNAEDRYQSAVGLKYDLEQCIAQLQETGRLEPFEIGKRDIGDRFIIPEKLYGRESEVSQLLEAFERVSTGSTEMMLVAGFSGIGKTAVINEVHKPIVRQRGYFIKGKFDQFNRSIPFSAFAQALQDLMRQLMSESDRQLQAWKTQILEAVGNNGQLLIEVIPELEWLIGVQPPVPELSGMAAQNRFNFLFQKFIAVFTTVKHPLVLFLDDLQWADLASLGLMKLLMEDKGHLLLLGAYRDNEVSPVHPFILTVDELVKAGATVTTITLPPLHLDCIDRAIADTLGCQPEAAQPLSKWVYQKTRGNPFFTVQFLKGLHQDGYITFDYQAGVWQCDLARVKALSITDDVVEFIATQLQKLPAETQRVIKFAACIGSQFDLNVLAIVSEQSQTDTAAALWKGLQEGLILPISQTYKFFQNRDVEIGQQQISVPYKFLHDRVQQAAYSLIPEEQKQIVHLQIGRLLWHNTPETQQAERIFEIVGQLNAGIELITEPAERQQLAELNLTAGRKAKESTAYSAAIAYLNRGIELLPADSWKTLPQLTQKSYEEAAEVAFSMGDFQRMQAAINIVLQNTNTLLDRVRMYELQILSLQMQGQSIEAIALGREILKKLGIVIPEAITPPEIYQKVDSTLVALAEQKIEDLVHLPIMSDRQLLAAQRLMTSLIPCVFTTAPYLFPVIACEMVTLFLKSGNSPFSPPGYADFGIIVSSVLNKLEASYQFGNLALKALDIFPEKAIQIATKFKVASFILFNQQHIRDSIALLQEVYADSLETGDLLYVCVSAMYRSLYLYFSGTEILENISALVAAYQSTSSANEIFLLSSQILSQTIHNLTQLSQHPARLVGEYVDEEKLLPLLLARQESFVLHFLFLCKSQLAYLFGDFPAVLDYSAEGKRYLQGAAGMPTVALFHYYYALARLAVYPTAEPSDREILLSQVQEHHAHLKLRAEFAPMNFQHFCDLVEAELYRVLGNKTEAIEYYDLAISGAKENGYIQEEALANELAAKFYLNWGKEKVASGYMQEAYYCYAKWGAKAKIDDLERLYPHLLRPILQQAAQPFTVLETLSSLVTSTYSIHSTRSQTSYRDSLNNTIDLATLLQVSQAISSTIQLDELLQNLTQTVRENSGAEKCALILYQDDRLQVRVIADLTETRLQDVPLENHPNVPSKLIQYVKNTLEMLVIDNLQTDLSGLIGDYLNKYKPKSILCLPLLDRGNVVGILYLENRSTSGVFSCERVLILNFLCTQAAISLENARLYQKAKDYAQQLEQSQLQLVQSEKMSALGNLVAGIAHEINNPVGFISGNIIEALASVQDMTDVIKLYQDKFPNPGDEIEEKVREVELEYVLEDLPKMLDSMQVGCERIKGISTSLRVFSRADKNEKVPFNIHDGINSTLLILKHRLKANKNRQEIQVITDYGTIPEIQCFPGQLNQVFMNLLVNAIEALDEANTVGEFEKMQINCNRIIIKTLVINNQVQLSITDNGVGMNESVKQQVFDHLFTTKAVGKGTGLGLAIARQIIEEKHKGSIDVTSTLGMGTKFKIILPIGAE